MRLVQAFLLAGSIAVGIGAAVAQSVNPMATKDRASARNHAGPAVASSVSTANYSYDSLGRLIQETYPANTLTYTYDAVGNRVQSSTQ